MSAIQYINDLKWLLDGHETFVADIALADFLTPDYVQRLYHLEQNPAPLVSYMKQAKSHFLGTYFEQLFSFAVQNFTQLTVLAEHQQIQANGKTFGEIDLLARDPFGRCMQFEVALKFYLQRPDLAPNDWIGPNRNDSLKKKVDHARDHQLTVLDHQEGQQWLESVSGDIFCNKYLLIFGRHFYHLDGVYGQDVNVTPDLKGGWLYWSELAQYQSYFFDLVLAEKPCWMTPNREKSEKNQINGNFTEWLRQYFIEDERPKLFSCYHKPDNGQTSLFWLFICPDHW